MAGRYHNPFQAMDILVPDEYHEEVSRFSQRESGSTPERNPFPRMIDVWFLAVCIAAHVGMQPAEMSGRGTTKIVDGTIFGSDEWRVNMLTLIALAYSDGVAIADEPRKMINLMNGLAAAGLPKVIDMVRNGDGDSEGLDPIWRLSESIENILKKSAGKAA